MSIPGGQNSNADLPTASHSRKKMLPLIPKVDLVLKRFDASDLAEMLFGEDMPNGA